VIPEPAIREEVRPCPTRRPEDEQELCNTIELFGEEKAMRKRIMSIVMDSRTPLEPKPMRIGTLRSNC